MAVVTPKITLLNTDDIQRVHDAAVTILETTGIRVDDPGARKVIGAAVGAKAEHDRFYIPGDLVKWAIQATPPQVELFRRDGKPAFALDSSISMRTVFGIGVTNLFFQEPMDDRVVPFERRHMAYATRLGDALDEFDVISTPGVIQNIEPIKGELLGTLEMLANTTKPLILLVSDPDAFAAALDMIEELVGFSMERPFVMPYFNPLTPLVLNSETTVKIELAISKGLPVIFSNYGMAGATSPISPGGTLALLTAELLAGLVYCQLLKEGTPVVLGSLPAYFDMGSMSSIYSPQSMLLNLACAEMMSHCNLPHCGTSGGSFGWGPDLIAGGLLWANHLTGILGKVGFIPFVGSNFDSKVFSPATVVYAAEVIRYARNFGEGFSLGAEDVDLGEIDSMGPGGNYLTSSRTLENFRAFQHASRIWPIHSLESWEEKGRPEAGEELRKYTDKLLQKLAPPEDHDKLLSQGEKFIRKETPS
jgi:trimethylamine--corrinoid protein Co-methyltransferase